MNLQTEHANKPTLTMEQRLAGLVTADERKLAMLDRILSGDDGTNPEQKSTRLLNFRQASERLGVSRSTVFRMVEDGLLPTVTLRKNRRRIREADVLELTNPEKWVRSENSESPVLSTENDNRANCVENSSTSKVYK